MQNFIFAFSSIAPLFIQIALGYFLKKKNVIDKHFMDTAGDFVYHYLYPLIMFRQIYQIDVTSNINPVFIIYGVIITIVLGLLLWIIVPLFIKDRQSCGAFIQGSYRSNCILIGVSLSISVFGEAGSLPTIILLPFASVAYNIISLIILTVYSPDNKKVTFSNILAMIIKNPIIIGVFTGVTFSLIKINVPSFLSEVIDNLANIATPLALISLGGQLEVKSFFKKPGLIISGIFVKLIISPLIVILPAVVLFSFTPYEIGALFFIFGSSTAVSSYVMAKVMKSDDVLAGQLVMYTTIFSSVTMFLWIYVLKNLHLI